MLYCENCRAARKLLTPATYPYHRHAVAKCELCNKHVDCYDYPALFAKQPDQRTEEENLLYKILQQEYKSKAESLVITYVSGPRAGAINQDLTNNLKHAIIKNRQSGEIDWYATWELRTTLQAGYQKVEHR